MEKPTVSVNLGSNLGDRRANLLRAVAEIERRIGVKARVSEIHEYETWGYRSDNPFYNMEAEFETDIEPAVLLHEMQAIELAAGSGSHRKADGSYADRLLDIDIIYAGSLTVDTEELQLPHPRMAERTFVLEPLAELSPDWKHPSTGLTVREMLQQAAKKGEKEQ